jgi:acetolactate synthase-1/2/3 large subunit
MGMLGSHGSAAANHAIHNADLLLILGARVGDRAMSTAGEIAKKAKIIHIDVDPAEIGKNIDVTIPIVGDARQVLKEMAAAAEPGDTAAWVDKLQKMKQQRREARKTDAASGYVNPKKLLAELSRLTGGEAVIATDVGQNQIWAANNLEIANPRHFITSGGMGTMGYGLPSAVGAKVGLPEAKVVMIGGDGGFQMTMQELGTIKQEKLDIKIIIFNNTRLGMVRELQKAKYCGRYCQVFLEDNPDFVKLVGAYGFEGRSLSDNNGTEEALEWLLSSKGTCLLECMVDPEESTL